MFTAYFERQTYCSHLS